MKPATESVEAAALTRRPYSSPAARARRPGSGRGGCIGIPEPAIKAYGARIFEAQLKANNQTWANRLRAFIAEHQAKHGGTDEEILGVAVDRCAGSLAEGAAYAAELLGERKDVKRGNMFFASVRFGDGA